MLRRDVRSILLIRAATAYNLLADNAFILERYGRSVRFARVGFYCCCGFYFDHWNSYALNREGA